MKLVERTNQGELKQEVLMKLVNHINGKTITKKFYAERTPVENILVFPYSMIDNLREGEDCLIGDAPEGEYFMGKIPVKIERIYWVIRNVYGFAEMSIIF